VPEWTIGTGCKPVGLRPTGVRIPPSPPCHYTVRLGKELASLQDGPYNGCVKKCSRCKLEKDGTHFQRNRASKDGLQDQCKACRKETDRRTYLSRTPEKTAFYKEQECRTIEQNKQRVYDYLLTHPCVDCGESDPVVLEFDHVSGEKRSDIANWIMSGRSWRTILSEIEKCEVRCANCHRRVTARRFGTWRYQRHLENTPT
jgi:hypothetical protein